LRKRLLICSHLSFCPTVWNNWATTGLIFIKFNIWVFSENASRKFRFCYKLKRVTDTLDKDQYTFLLISYWIIFRMKNVSDKCTENQNWHFTFNISFFFFFGTFCLFEIVKIIIHPVRPHTTIWRRHIASWRPDTINSHSEYVIIVAFDWNSSSTNAPECYFIRPLPVLFNGILKSICHI